MDICPLLWARNPEALSSWFHSNGLPTLYYLAIGIYGGSMKNSNYVKEFQLHKIKSPQTPNPNSSSCGFLREMYNDHSITLPAVNITCPCHHWIAQSDLIRASFQCLPEQLLFPGNDGTCQEYQRLLWQVALLYVFSERSLKSSFPFSSMGVGLAFPNSYSCWRLLFLSEPYIVQRICYLFSWPSSSLVSNAHASLQPWAYLCDHLIDICLFH